MPYKVSVTKKDGYIVELPEVHLGQTPWKNELLKVKINGDATQVIVTGVKKFLSKSSGTAVEPVDDVDAREL